MLMLNSQSWTIEGIQIFADHADPKQFWYLPGPVRLTRRREDGRAEFTFIKVRAATAGTEAKGAGFVTFSVDLALDPSLERRIVAKLSSMARGKPRLSAVPFDEGTVRVIALDLDSGAATARAAIPAGGFRAVEQALGATVPSLDAVNRASFSLTLTQEGATILDEAFAKGGTPVGVIYDLKYSGMRPALDVTITADMTRIYKQFSSSADAQVMFVRTGIDQGFEKLVQDGAIKIKVNNFTGAADLEAKETWALTFFKDHLLAAHFTPSLTVGTLTGGFPQAEALDAVRARGDAMRPPATPAPTKPTADEPVTRPGPAADPEDSATVGSGKGGAPAGTVRVPAGGGEGESATEGTGEAGGAATTAELGSAAASGVVIRAAAAPGVPAGAAPAAAAAPAAGADTPAPQAVASFRFRGITQEERKTITLSYSRAEAVQRAYAPQGFFGLLAGDLDRAGHFIEVDLDDPFFRVMDLRVNTVQAMTEIGLKAVEVSLSYGKPTDPGGVKTHDMRFEGDTPAEQGWKVFQNDGEVQEYDYTVQYHFDPASGFEGRALSYSFGPMRTADRTLVLNPHDKIGIATVEVAANQVDWGQVTRIDVALQNGGRNKVVALTRAAPSAKWKLRLDDPADRVISYAPSFVMKDRSVRPGVAGRTETASVLIDDPFPDGLDLQLIPILDASRTRMAFVDFSYEDARLGYKRHERFKVTPADTDQTVRIGLPAGAAQIFDYKITIVPVSGTMQSTSVAGATETLIAIAD